MKGTNHKISNIMGAAVAAASIMFSSTACGIINEDLDPCPETGVNLSFVYDYNMERANAFHNQVDCLTVYIYDKDGNYVTKMSETSGALKDESYRLPMSLPEGQYRVIAYGGMECEKSSFVYPESFDGSKSIGNLRTTLHPDCLQKEDRRLLHNHFYGSAVFEVMPNTDTDCRVEMMRNTNSIQVALQNIYGSPISHEDFDFSITDDNTLFDYDNNLIPTGEVTYRPYLTETRIAGNIPGDKSSEMQASENQASVAMAHFSTSRIVRKKATQTTLHVSRKSDGIEVLRLPLASYMLLFKENHGDTSPMGDQEYLDRENSWRFVFFLDDHKGQEWISARIVINDWLVVINNTEF